MIFVISNAYTYFRDNALFLVILECLRTTCKIINTFKHASLLPYVRQLQCQLLGQSQPCQRQLSEHSLEVKNTIEGRIYEN